MQFIILVNKYKFFIHIFILLSNVAAKSLQSCPTLCNPIDGSPPGSPVPGILQARITRVGCHFLLQCMKVKSESEVSQSCPTLRDPMDCSLPGSSVHGIFQARVLEWGAIAFSNVCARSFQSCLTLCDLWTVTHQAPLSMGILQARRLEWVDMSSSRESWKPRDQTCVPCIGKWILNHWTTREVPHSLLQ